MKVIIGAGPAGLYTAIKLRKAGIRDVVVYDPRAGTYTRPGHLNTNAFVTAERSSSAHIDADLLSGARTGHIKDLERQLYREAKRLGIQIENKIFIEFIPDATKPAVVVADLHGTREIVEAEYVFDCTGTSRQVIHAVNALSAEPPFKIKTIANLPVKNHFLAYVKVPSSEFPRLNAAALMYDVPSHLIRPPLNYARSILKLRALGWNELKFPRFYGVSFGKKGESDKACLYFHAPEGLLPRDYDLWVNTVIECYTAPIHFEHYPPPRKFDSKPRFLAFNSKAEVLESVSYKGEGLPTVIALGDAQIDFDYYLAHGIKDGLERIDALFEEMDIIEGRILYFNADDYLIKLRSALSAHKDAVTEQATNIKASFSSALESAQLSFRQAMMQTTDSDEIALFDSVLTEIMVRQSYNQAATMFPKCHNEAHQVSFTSSTITSVMAKLEQIHTNLLNAYTHIPVSFDSERQHAKALLTYLPESWKTIGNALVKSGKHAEAIEAYKKAIAIYNLPSFAGHHALNELPLYSNLVIAYLKGQHFPEAIAAGKAALATYTRCEAELRPAALYEKIVFNLLKAMCTQVKALLLIRQKAEATSLRSQAEHLLQTHKTALEGESHAQITTMMQELQVSLAVSSPALAALALQRAESLGALRLPSAETGETLAHSSLMELPAGKPSLSTRASSISEGTQTDGVANSAATAAPSAPLVASVTAASARGLFSEGLKPQTITLEAKKKSTPIGGGCCIVS